MTGNSNYIATNVIYLDDFAFSGGVSTLDHKNGVLYFTIDMRSTLVYSVDLGSKQPNPPIDIGATLIIECAFPSY